MNSLNIFSQTKRLFPEPKWPKWDCLCLKICTLFHGWRPNSPFQQDHSHYSMEWSGDIPCCLPQDLPWFSGERTILSMAKKTAAAWGLEVAENVLQERHPSAQAKGMQREAFAENVPAGILGTAKKTWRIWRWFLRSMMIYDDFRWSMVIHDDLGIYDDLGSFTI